MSLKFAQIAAKIPLLDIQPLGTAALKSDDPAKGWDGTVNGNMSAPEPTTTLSKRKEQTWTKRANLSFTNYGDINLLRGKTK